MMHLENKFLPTTSLLLNAATEQTETIRNISNMYSSMDHKEIQYS